MSGYSNITLIVALGILLLIYTILYDLWIGFADLAETAGADPTVISYLLILWTWYPLIQLFSLTFGYLIENQRWSPY